MINGTENKNGSGLLSAFGVELPSSLTKEEPKENKRLSNIELLEKIATRNDEQGLMNQVFMIEAMRFYAELIIETEKPKEAGSEVISNIMWYETATLIHEELMKNFE
jgi:hypothetical protein